MFIYTSKLRWATLKAAKLCLHMKRVLLQSMYKEYIHKKRTLKEVLEVFRREGITGGPIYDISQIVDDPHFQEREIIVDLPDKEMGVIPMHNIFPKLSNTPGTFRRAAPDLGQDNDEILGAAGVNADTLAELRSRGII